jgi:putative ABC transport system permease protein
MTRNSEVPPEWARRFLRFICPDHLLEEIEGDLLQRFSRDIRAMGHAKARRNFVWGVVAFCRPGILLRNKFSLGVTPLYIWINYFRVASRIMIRNRLFSGINVSGLVVGITSASLLFLWINVEHSYDTFHRDVNQIHKAWNRNNIEGQLQCWDLTPRILAPTLRDQYESVESSVSYAQYGTEFLFRTKEKSLVNPAGVFTEQEFLDIFSFRMKEGDPKKAFLHPSGVILTEKFARQLFGDGFALGEPLVISESGYDFDFEVAGVLEDLPSNTEFRFDYIIPYHFVENLEGRQSDWNNSNVHTYVKLKEGADPDLFNTQVAGIVKNHTDNANDTEIFLYPLTKMRLYSRFENGLPAGGRIEILRMITSLGVGIVLIACINFVNLSTARAQKRAREVGIRKATGANRVVLVTQFLCESVLLAVIAGVVSVLLVALLLPSFSNLVQQQITFSSANAGLYAVGAASILLIGLLAGIYPALYLSRFRPAVVIKGVIMASSGNVFRRALVVLQFGLAVTLIFSTVVVNEQITFVQNREAGYDQANLVFHSLTGEMDRNYHAYRHELLQSDVAVSVTRTSSPITQSWSKTWGIDWDGKDPQTKIVFERYHVDDQFVKTAGLTLTAGRDMDLTRFPADSSSMLINEAAVKVMGFIDPVGQIVKDGSRECRVVGVVKDFILASPFHKTTPMVIQGGKVCSKPCTFASMNKSRCRNA